MRGRSAGLTLPLTQNVWLLVISLVVSTPGRCEVRDERQAGHSPSKPAGELRVTAHYTTRVCCRLKVTSMVPKLAPEVHVVYIEQLFLDKQKTTPRIRK